MTSTVQRAAVWVNPACCFLLVAVSFGGFACGARGGREGDVRDAADRVVAALSGVYVGDVRTSGCPFEGQSFELHVDVDRASLECQDEDAAASCDQPVDSGHMSVVLSVWVGETTFVHEDGFVSLIPDGYDDPSTHVIPGLPAGWPEIVRVSAQLDRLGPDAKLEELGYGAAADAFRCGFFVTAPL